MFRSRRPRRFIAALLMGAAALALGVGSAQAKPGAPTAAAAKRVGEAKPVADDGLGARDVYFEADRVIDDRTQHTVTAEGHVEMRYQGRTLRADRVVYTTTTGAIHATGQITIVNADGTVEYSHDLKLDDQFRVGVALGFSARLQDNTTIAAGAAIRRSEDVNEFKSAIYTSCNICKADGVTPKTPTWSVQADRITEDRANHVIYYRHAIIRVLGVPVFYAPIFWHPDPTATKRSGFLTPKIGYIKRRGAFAEIPYLWAISPYADLVIDPQINTTVAPFLNLRYRERFYSGSIDLRAGYTYERLFDSHTKFGDDTSRSYLLGKGQFQLDPRWTVGFGVERVTDPTLFRRYGVPDVFTDRGPFPTDTDRLISQLYANRQDGQSYLSVAALSFQSLRAAVVQTTSTGGVVSEGLQSYDSGQAFPVVVPVAEARFDPAEPILGGRLRVTGSAVALTRNNPVIATVDPLGIAPAGAEPYSYHGVVETVRPTPTATDPLSSLTYRDSRRISADANWQTSFTFDSGIRIQPFAALRGSAFSTDEGELLSGVGATLQQAKSFSSRGVASVGATASWPFIKPVGGGSLVLEPIVQIIASNTVKPDANIPNEDSVSFEYDESNLFSINRFPGYDLDEGGQRANIGARATLDLLHGRSASLLVGRTFRAEPDLVFTPQSGLRGTSSDWITAVTVTPIAGLSLFNRARLDADNFDVKREEAGLNFNYGRLFAAVRYLYEQSGVVQVECVNPALTPGGPTCPSPFTSTQVAEGSTVVGRVENAEITGTWFFTKNWGVSVNATRDFVGYQTNGKYRPVFPIAQLDLIYQNECLRLDALYTHDETYSATIGPSNSFAIRLTLNTLGGTLASAQHPRTAR